MNQARLGTTGFDLFVPTASLGAVLDKLIAAAREVGGRACGWQALEAARIEAGIPRYGADMDETNLAPEPGIESRADQLCEGLLHRAGSHRAHSHVRAGGEVVARAAAARRI